MGTARGGTRLFSFVPNVVQNQKRNCQLFTTKTYFYSINFISFQKLTKNREIFVLIFFFLFPGCFEETSSFFLLLSNFRYWSDVIIFYCWGWGLSMFFVTWNVCLAVAALRSCLQILQPLLQAHVQIKFFIAKLHDFG